MPVAPIDLRTRVSRWAPAPSHRVGDARELADPWSRFRRRMSGRSDRDGLVARAARAEVACAAVVGPSASGPTAVRMNSEGADRTHRPACGGDAEAAGARYLAARPVGIRVRARSHRLRLRPRGIRVRTGGARVRPVGPVGIRRSAFGADAEGVGARCSAWRPVGIRVRVQARSNRLRPVGIRVRRRSEVRVRPLEPVGIRRSAFGVVGVWRWVRRPALLGVGVLLRPRGIRVRGSEVRRRSEVRVRRVGLVGIRRSAFGVVGVWRWVRRPALLGVGVLLRPRGIRVRVRRSGVRVGCIGVRVRRVGLVGIRRSAFGVVGV